MHNGAAGPVVTADAASIARPSVRTGVIVVLLAVVLLSCAVIGDRGWHHARAHHADEQITATRDAALAAGTTGLEAFSTIDGKHPQATVTRWLGITSGQLHTTLTSETATLTKQITSAKATATVHLLAASLTAFDDDAGTASVAAALDVRTTTGKRSQTTTQRFVALLARTGGQWKLTGLEAIGASQ